MSARSEAKAAKLRARAAERAEEMLALPFVIDESTASLPAKPALKEIEPGPDGERESKREAEKAYARTVHGEHLSGIVYRDQMRFLADGPVYEDTAMDYASDFVERVAPQNALEKVLAEQLLWSHTRAAALSIRACRETSPQRVRTVNQAADGASNTSRKLAQALIECRRPARGGDTFMAIGQANVAGQQVVQNDTPTGAGDATK